VPLVPEWLQFRLRFWALTLPRLLVYPYFAAKRRYRRKHE
jgi:hypothetical protein